jgi:hypothetical protein
MRHGSALRPLAVVLALALVAPAILHSRQAALGEADDEVQRLAQRIRDRLVETRTQIARHGYFEEDTEIQLDSDGREQERETKVFAVSPAVQGREPDSRLVSVDGRPPTAEERAEDDERRANEGDDSREEGGDSSRRRREAVEDLYRGLVVRIDGREAVNGVNTTILAFEPKPGARLRSGAARFIRAMRGRVWVTAEGNVVQVDASLVDNVSVGWGVIARIWKGSWFRGRQQLRDDHWVPLEFTAEAQGRTLLFRTFRTRYVVKYWGYRLGAAPDSEELRNR